MQAVRSGCQLPIDYKLALRQENPHYGNAGVLIGKLATFIPALEKAGVQSFQLQTDSIQLASMCRQLIADPQWVNKVAQQKEKSIVHCIGCNKKCLGGIVSHQGVHCILEEKRRNLK